MGDTRDAACEIHRLLRRMVRDLLARKPGGHLVSGSVDEIVVHLPASGGDDQGFAEDRAARLEEEVDEAIRRASAFRPGHVYCHRCRAAACQHSSPPTGQHVFTGYNPTGTPLWEPMAQALLALRHPEVNALYDNPRALVTLVQDSATLRGTMLEAWQNPGCEVVGQLVAGFFRPPGASTSNGERLALTLQVTAARTPKHGLRLGLNLLGAPDEAWPVDLERPWRRPLRWAQDALASVAVPRGRGRRRRLPSQGEVEERVLGILTGLSRRLRQERSGRTRRTGHAQERHQSGERPTRKALDDVRVAPAGAFLLDERNDTLVVLGERGRTHFFTPAGRLASSVRYSRDAIAGKQRRGQWRPAPAARVAGLRAMLTAGAAAEHQSGLKD